MKNIYFLPLLLAIFLFSCEKAVEPDLSVNPFTPNTTTDTTGGGTGGGGTTTPGTFTYKADGVQVTVTALQAVEVFDTSAGNMGESVIVLTGLDASQYLYLWIDRDATVGTHEIGAFANDYEMDYIKLSNLTDPYSAEESVPVMSEYNITKHDKAAKRIEGTFYGNCLNFSGTDSVQITDGTFAVTYTVQ